MCIRDSLLAAPINAPSVAARRLAHQVIGNRAGGTGMVGLNRLRDTNPPDLVVKSDVVGDIAGGVPGDPCAHQAATLEPNTANAQQTEGWTCLLYTSRCV